MPEIQVLSPHVADLIAAGEVVERPASVVKELMENAFDAGAKTVTVEIMNGGMSLIRVTDDGCGIPAGQAETAFLRHATSKLRDAGDLESIGTLGFRGEALAAICAVSRVELLTRTELEPLGVCLTLEGGAVIQREEAGCPAGTTMIVRDLFFNTPARLKFMKRDQAESAAVFGVIQREALAHPEVAVKFFRDGRQDLLTPGDGLLKSAIYAAFGRDIAMGFTPVRSLGDGISVEGFVSLPVCCRGSRSHQYFFVNGRYVKSLTMQAAVEEAYKNQKMVGKFPGCVIHLSVSLGSVDVNVHPAKTEVKFSDQNRVFSTVHHAVLNALDAGPSRPKAELTPPAPAKQPFRPIGSGQDLPLHAPAPLFSARTADGPVSSPLPLRRRSTEPAVLRDTPRGRFVPAGRAVDVAPPERDFDLAPVPVPVPVPEAPPVPAPKAPRSPEPEVSSMPPAPVPETAPARQEQTPDPVLPLRTPDWTVRGELFLTYIVVEQGDKVFLIDKHAAHERMNFDRLKAADWKPMAQQLLTPVVFSPAAEEKAVLLGQEELLKQFGFAVEDFGTGAVAVTQAPDEIPEGKIAATLEELARRLLTTGTADAAGARDELLHTMACKAAIKGGWKSAGEELEAVAAAVMRGEVKYCPHGRPVAIELTKKQLEKQFKRA